MASLRDIRDRIQSVKNTRQITRAMKLVAGAKLNKAVDAASSAKPYSETLARVLQRVAAAAGDVEHPLLITPDENGKILVLVFTSDRGLCGGFNTQICRHGLSELKGLRDAGKSITLWCYGKKGRAYFSGRGFEVAHSVEDIDPKSYADLAEDLRKRLEQVSRSGEYERVLLIRSEYISIMVQTPRTEQLLPMEVSGDGDEAAGDYLFEPSGDELLGRLLPLVLRTQVFQAFLESQAGEQASRMTAMDAATRNASELIDSLTLDYNRARQAAITKELIEIVSGAEAL